MDEFTAITTMEYENRSQGNPSSLLFTHHTRPEAFKTSNETQFDLKDMSKQTGAAKHLDYLTRSQEFDVHTHVF